MGKVWRGTPTHGDNLCLSCASGTLRRGQRVSEEEIWCHALGAGDGPARVPFAVSECGSYRDKALARPDMFYHTGWVFIPDVGFVPPDEYRKKQRKGEVT